MGFWTFTEGSRDEMFSGVDVAHVVARADVALGVNHLARSEIECEALSGARHMIERGWGRFERRRGGWALGFAVTFPEGAFGGEQVLGEAHMDVVVVEDIVEVNDIFCRDFVEEDVGFGVAGVRCCCNRGCWCERVTRRAVSVVVPQYVPVELKVLEEGLTKGGEGCNVVCGGGEGGQQRRRCWLRYVPRRLRYAPMILRYAPMRLRYSPMRVCSRDEEVGESYRLEVVGWIGALWR